MNSRAANIVTALLLAACASEEPASPASFDDSLGRVVIVVAADGFVRCDGTRMPLEAAVLALRQRTRQMSPDDMLRFVVQLDGEPQAPDSAAAETVQRAKNRLVDELYVMGVRQIRYQ